jgi:DNA-binding IscR family transcriptional regulator
MPTVDDYIFGNGAIHGRLRFATQVLAVLVSSAPRPVGIPDFLKYVGHPACELEQMCQGLQQAGLIHPAPHKHGHWCLACEPNTVTLEDVYRFVISESGTSCTQAREDHSEPEQLVLDVDLLMMQATMAVNQSVFKQLRNFSLDRLRLNIAGRPPTSRLKACGASYDNEYDFEVNAWLIDSVFQGRKRRR